MWLRSGSPVGGALLSGVCDTKASQRSNWAHKLLDAWRWPAVLDGDAMNLKAMCGLVGLLLSVKGTSSSWTQRNQPRNSSLNEPVLTVQRKREVTCFTSTKILTARQHFISNTIFRQSTIICRVPDRNQRCATCFAQSTDSRRLFTTDLMFYVMQLEDAESVICWKTDNTYWTP